MKWDIDFKGKIEKFPGYGGWTYIGVPQKYTKDLKKRRIAWGMYPITACVGKTTWSTKLMMKKGGGFFIALKADVRKHENITIGKYIKVQFKLERSKRK